MNVNLVLPEAFQLIKQAEEHDGNGNWRPALQCYEQALGGLVKGLQYEKHADRRRGLQEQVSRCIARAEELRVLLSENHPAEHGQQADAVMASAQLAQDLSCEGTALMQQADNSKQHGNADGDAVLLQRAMQCLELSLLLGEHDQQMVREQLCRCRQDLHTALTSGQVSVDALLRPGDRVLAHLRRCLGQRTEGADDEQLAALAQRFFDAHADALAGFS